MRTDNEAAVEDAVLALSHSRRIFAPLVFTLGAFQMLFEGLRALFSDWRLTLIQVLPAMWIWLAVLDLKLHAFKGVGFHIWHGGAQILLVVGIALVTASGFYLNAVFAFAISQPGVRIRPAFRLAARHLPVILGVGVVVGIALGVSAIVAPRWGRTWFVLSLGIVIGVMMFTYVTVPARIVGIKPPGSPKDKMAVAAIGGSIGALVCSPGYVLGRIGILLLGFGGIAFALGVVLLVIGFALVAGATGAVKALKMSAKLVVSSSTGRSTESSASETRR